MEKTNITKINDLIENSLKGINEIDDDIDTIIELIQNCSKKTQKLHDSLQESAPLRGYKVLEYTDDLLTNLEYLSDTLENGEIQTQINNVFTSNASLSTYYNDVYLNTVKENELRKKKIREKKRGV